MIIKAGGEVDKEYYPPPTHPTAVVGNVTGHVLIISEGDPVPLENVSVATEVGDV